MTNITIKERFREYCSEYNLSEALRDIYLVTTRDTQVIIVSIEGYRKIAYRSYPNMTTKVIAIYEGDMMTYDVNGISIKCTFDSSKKLLGAVCIAKRDNDSEEVYKYCLLSEYDKGTSLWRSMKLTMISKVAEAQVLRQMCPELAGTYSADEDWTKEAVEAKKEAPSEIETATNFVKAYKITKEDVTTGTDALITEFSDPFAFRGIPKKPEKTNEYFFNTFLPLLERDGVIDEMYK